MKILRGAGSFVLMLLLLAPAALACPLCGEGLNDGTRPTPLARGFGWSILIMLAVPACLVGAGIIALRRAIRRRESAA